MHASGAVTPNFFLVIRLRSSKQMSDDSGFPVGTWTCTDRKEGFTIRVPHEQLRKTARSRSRKTDRKQNSKMPELGRADPPPTEQRIVSAQVKSLASHSVRESRFPGSASPSFLQVDRIEAKFRSTVRSATPSLPAISSLL